MFKYLVTKRRSTARASADTCHSATRTHFGALSPFLGTFNGNSKVDNELYAPFSSAKDGAKPEDANGWKFTSAKNPFSTNCSSTDMAKAMYNTGTPAEIAARDADMLPRRTAQRTPYTRAAA